MNKNITLNLLYWILFSILISFIPLFYEFWKNYCTKPSTDLITVIKEVIKHGDLILISVTLLSAIIGDLIKDDIKYKNTRIILVGIILICIIFSTLTLSDLKHETITIEYAFNTSLIIFSATCIFGFSSIILKSI